MALKFLNKKGWHTGSLRNIENVWKAEQKHEAEQKKLDELRKQILEERERSEFRLLQEQAGLVPKQERLDFLYDSGLAVGKGASSSDKGGAGGGGGFKALEEALPITNNNNNNINIINTSSSANQQSSAPGALFEDKPHSANDAWRKLHSDPLLLIRQREQEALVRVKNNPVQMSIIRKSVEEKKKHKVKSHDKKESKKKHHHTSSKKHHRHSEDDSDGEDKRKKSSYLKRSNSDNHYSKAQRDSEDELSERQTRKKNHYRSSKKREGSPNGISQPKIATNDYQVRNHDKSKHDKYASEGRSNYDTDRKERGNTYDSSSMALQRESHHKRRNVAPKLSEEERAARLREMQVDAKLHEEQRWKRLRKAEEDDAREATRASISSGRNFLDAAKKSVYGAEKGGSSTIEESVRRRTHYLQGRSEAGEGNAFRR